MSKELNGKSHDHRSGSNQPASTAREPTSVAQREPQSWVRAAYGANWGLVKVGKGKKKKRKIPE
jgi:hypothetical protein